MRSPSAHATDWRTAARQATALLLMALPCACRTPLSEPTGAEATGDAAAGVGVDLAARPDLAERCLEPREPTLVSSDPLLDPPGRGGFINLALDERRVYWTAASAVHAVDKVGGVSAVLAVDALGSISPIAVDADAVYWVGGKGLRAVPKGGGTSRLLSDRSGFPSSIVLSNRDVYWTNTKTQDVVRASKSGGGVSTVASGISYPAGIALDATSVYWTSTDGQGKGGTLMRAPLAGGAAGVLASPILLPTAVATGDGFLYVQEGSGNVGARSRVWRTDPDGGNAIVLSDDSGPPPNAVPLVVGDRHVYWVRFDQQRYGWGDAQSVWRVGKDGSTPCRLATETWITSLAVDPSGVYFAAANRILRVPVD